MMIDLKLLALSTTANLIHWMRDHPVTTMNDDTARVTAPVSVASAVILHSIFDTAQQLWWQQSLGAVCTSSSSSTKSQKTAVLAAAAAAAAATMVSRESDTATGTR